MQNVFVYGTLMSAKLLKILTGEYFTTSPALLKNYKRYCVRVCDYPAMVYKKGYSVRGLLIEKLNKKTFEILKDYEGEEYKSKKVTVISNGQQKEAITFIWVRDQNLLEEKEWDIKNFEENILNDYLNFIIPAKRDDFENE